MRIKVYQIDHEKDAKQIRFESLETANMSGGVDSSIYKTAFYGDVEADDLEDIFRIFNTDEIPGTHQGHSLSVSDVVEVLDDVPELVGRIDFLGSNGLVGETIEYTDSAKYNQEIADSRECGRPFSATRLADKHIPAVEKGCYFCDSVSFEKIDFNSSLCVDMKGKRVLFVTPHHTPVEIHIGNDLKSMQRAVGGLIEMICPFEDESAILVCNEEGKLNGMEGNRRLEDDVIAGPFFIIRDDGNGGTTDLTDEQVEKYVQRFAEPEDISPEEIKDHLGFTFISM